MKPNKKNRIISIVIKNKDGVLYEGEASAVTSINEKGVFDILALHENFISLVKDFIRIHKLNKEIQEIKIDQGIVKVAANKINVYVGFEA